MKYVAPYLRILHASAEKYRSWTYRNSSFEPYRTCCSGVHPSATICTVRHGLPQPFAVFSTASTESKHALSSFELLELELYDVDFVIGS